MVPNSILMHSSCINSFKDEERNVNIVKKKGVKNYSTNMQKRKTKIK